MSSRDADISAPQTQPSQSQPRPRQSAGRSKRRGSVLGYLVVLFAVAFLLLLVAYFQQQRSNSEATDALKQSASAVETLQLLMQNNDDLHAQVEAMQGELEDLKQGQAALQSDLQAQQRSVEAMQWFWQINEAYARGRYTTARNLIQQFESLSLKDHLPTENTTGTDRFSPAARYAEIYDALY